MKKFYLEISFFVMLMLFSNSATMGQAVVKTGAEILIEKHVEKLKNRSIGLVMNPTARIGNVHVLDTLINLRLNVKALYSPEHGFRGQFSDGEIIEDGFDQETGLPVYSLYGSTKKPTAQMLKGIDLLLFDMQDVGARFYTFNTTMRYIIEAASVYNIEVWILDRPNPVGGNYISGWVLDSEFESTVGSHYTPVAHGMTLGELAMMGIGEGWYDLKDNINLKIIEMEGWKRSMNWYQTGLEWVPPSPNLPTYEHALVYLGTCFIEGTTISEGRGTNNPFLTIGAPEYIPNFKEISRLEEQFSVVIDTLSFIPKSIPGKSVYPKYEDELIKGVKISTPTRLTKPVEFGVAITNHFLNNSSDVQFIEYINLLVGYDALSSDSLVNNWKDEVKKFGQLRKKYLIYK